MTRIDPDDPKWTAYVLGELSESERAAVQSELDTSNEARAFVEELQYVANLTKTELRNATGDHSLTTQQRTAIRLAANPRRRRHWFSVSAVWASGAAAAVVAIALILMVRPTGPQNAYLERKSVAETDVTDHRYTEQSSTPLLDAQPKQAEAPRSALVEPSGKPAAIAEQKKILSAPVTNEVKATDTLADAREDLARTSDGGDRATPQAKEAMQRPTRQDAPESPEQIGQIGQQPLGSVSNASQFGSAQSPTTPPDYRRAISNLRARAEADKTANDSPFVSAARNPLSPFPIDVDTASYSIVRSYLFRDQAPPRNAVRIEEMVNYFTYDYPPPGNDQVISVSIESASAPWNPQHRLVRIGIKTRDADPAERPSILGRGVGAEVEFDPSAVESYRRIADESSSSHAENLNADLKDPGTIAAGQTVTLQYEVILRRREAAPSTRDVANRTLTVRFRYSDVDGAQNRSLVFPFTDRGQTFDGASADFRFAAAVASFAMILSESPYKGSATLDRALDIAQNSLGSDRDGYRHEFLQLIERARRIRSQ